MLLLALPAYGQDADAIKARAFDDGVRAMRASEYLRAEDAFTTAIANGDKRWRTLLMRGYARYRLGREGALEDLQAVAERHPEMAYVWAAEAMIVDMQNRFDMEMRRRAVGLMDRAIERDPKEAIYYALRGRLKVDINHFADAMTDFNTALEMSPDNVTILKIQLRALTEWGDHEAQAEQVRQALKKLDPDNKARDPDLPPPPLP